MFNHAKEIETIHNRFCRSVLKVPKNTSVCCVIGDLGHLPMYIVRKQRLLKYWLKIITKKPYIVYDVYKLLVTDSNNGKDNWATNIRNLLFQLTLHLIYLMNVYLTSFIKAGVHLYKSLRNFVYTNL